MKTYTIIFKIQTSDQNFKKSYFKLKILNKGCSNFLVLNKMHQEYISYNNIKIVILYCKKHLKTGYSIFLEFVFLNYYFL